MASHQGTIALICISLLTIISTACDDFIAVEFVNPTDETVQITTYTVPAQPDQAQTGALLRPRKSMSEILGTIDPNGREDWLLYGDPLPPSEIEVLHVMEANDPDGILIFRGVFTWTQLVDMGFVVTIDAGRLDEIP